MSSNLISITFSEEEINNIKKSLDDMELIILSKAINLSPEERQFYGRLGKKTENWVKKVKHHMEDKPNLVPFYIDKPEFDRDLQSHEEIMPMLERIGTLRELLNDTAKLLSTDLYNASIAYYRNIKLSSQQDVPGTMEIYEDLTKGFSGRNSSVPEENLGKK